MTASRITSETRFGGRTVWERALGRLRHRRGRPAPPLSAPVADIVEPTGYSSAPIFIVGVQRSGTSLLRRIVNSHPRLACPPESRFIRSLVEMLRDPGSMRGLESMGYGRAQVNASIAAFIDAMFRRYAEAQGKQRWADKTPQYVDCLHEIHDIFGGRARFVIIVRHGMDVSYSLSDPHRSYPAINAYVESADGDVPIGAAQFWVDKSREVEAFRRHHADSCLQIRYEDLTINPEATLRPVFSFLGEEWDPIVLDYNRREHHVGMEDPDVKRRRRIEPNSGRFEAWPLDVQRAVRETCEPMLTVLGYS